MQVFPKNLLIKEIYTPMKNRKTGSSTINRMKLSVFILIEFVDHINCNFASIF